MSDLMIETEMMDTEPGIYISQRELVEWIELTKQNNADIRELVETLKGNSRPGLVREVDLIRWKLNIVTATLLLFVTPLAGLLVSFLIGLVIHRIELVMH